MSETITKPIPEEPTLDDLLEIEAELTQKLDPTNATIKISELNEASDPDSRRALTNYLNEIGRIPLLSRQEEIRLAQQRDRGNLASTILEESTLSQTIKLKLESHTKEGVAASQKLVKANLRLVVSTAKKYRGRGLPFEDLIQEGNLGLMMAVEKYDWEKGYKVSTYAVWWIRQAITKAIAEKARTIAVPVKTQIKLTKLQDASNTLPTASGHLPSAEELARELIIYKNHLAKKEPTNTPPNEMQVKAAMAEVVEILTSTRIPLSLDLEPISQMDDARSLAERIPGDEHHLPPEIAYDKESLSEELENLISAIGLTPRNEKILRTRFGLPIDGRYREEIPTLEELGAENGLTRARIQQIEAEALSKLRQPAELRGLDNYLRRDKPIF